MNRVVIACLGVVLLSGMPAGAQAPASATPSAFIFGTHALIGTLPSGFQLIEEATPGPASKRWGFVAPAGPDGIRPAIQIGLFEGPPAVPFTFQQFADFVVSGMRMTYGNWTGQFAEVEGDRQRLEWSGVMRRNNDIVPMRGVVLIGSMNGGFFRLDAIHSAGLAEATLPLMERALAAFSTGIPVSEP